MVCVTGVVYRIQEVKDPSYPLHLTPYFGQTQGANSAVEIAKRRWSSHKSKSKNCQKMVGILAALKERGWRAFEFTILETLTADQSLVEEWLDRREIELIAQNGGVVRDMEQKLNQTLNIFKGGRHCKRICWVAYEACQLQLWRRFKRNAEETVKKMGTIDVPNAYTCCNGYRIGIAIKNIRHKGAFLQGRADEQERRAWLQQLPGWCWGLPASLAAKKRAARQEREDPGYWSRRSTAQIKSKTKAEIQEAAEKQKTTKSSEKWKQDASVRTKRARKKAIDDGTEAKRLESHRATTLAKRQKLLDACTTDKDREKLEKQFQRSDKNIERKRRLREV